MCCELSRTCKMNPWTTTFSGWVQRAAEDHAICLKTSGFEHILGRKSVCFTPNRKFYGYSPQKEVMSTVLMEMVDGKRYFKVNVFLWFWFRNSEASIPFLNVQHHLIKIKVVCSLSRISKKHTNILSIKF